MHEINYKMLKMPLEILRLADPFLPIGSELKSPHFSMENSKIDQPSTTSTIHASNPCIAYRISNLTSKNMASHHWMCLDQGF